MRPGVSKKEVLDLLDARIELLRCQRHLWWARVTGQSRPVVLHWEGRVKVSLTVLWAAQICVGEFDASRS